MENVNPNEIKNFDQLAQDWWDPDGPMQPLHQLNPLRTQYIIEHTNVADQAILDVGCGGGLLATSLAEAGGRVSAIDMSKELIAVAQYQADKKKLDIAYTVTTAEDFALKHSEKFDVITCMEMLEHVPNPQSVIQACSNMLKPGGKIFFSTLNRTLKSFAVAIVGAEYILNKLPKGTHHYKEFIKPSELNTACENAGLTLDHLQGVTYHPFKKCFSLSDDISVNYMGMWEK